MNDDEIWKGNDILLLFKRCPDEEEEEEEKGHFKTGDKRIMSLRFCEKKKKEAEWIAYSTASMIHSDRERQRATERETEGTTVVFSALIYRHRYVHTHTYFRLLEF